MVSREPTVLQVSRACLKGSSRPLICLRIRCKWCPCVFLSLADFNSHLDAFGLSSVVHRKKWANLMFERKHRESF